MTLDLLLEKLNSSMFEETDFDDILDLRDEETLVSKYREAAYKKGDELCENSEISDDFGLICESQLTHVSNPWLMELIKRYEAPEIPCGKLL